MEILFCVFKFLPTFYCDDRVERIFKIGIAPGAENNVPVILSVVTKADPLAYGIDGMRHVFLGHSAFDPRLDFVVLLILAAVLLVVGAQRFSKIEI